MHIIDVRQTAQNSHIGNMFVARFRPATPITCGLWCFINLSLTYLLTLSCWTGRHTRR